MDAKFWKKVGILAAFGVVGAFWLWSEEKRERALEERKRKDQGCACHPDEGERIEPWD